MNSFDRLCPEKSWLKKKGQFYNQKDLNYLSPFTFNTTLIGIKSNVINHV